MPSDAADSRWQAYAVAAAFIRIEVARSAEPAITPVLAEIVAANEVALVRLDTKYKSLTALTDKIRAGMESCDVAGAARVADRVPDVLRYTALLPDEEYWDRGTRLCEDLVAAGYNQVLRSAGWNEVGYKGRNERFETPDGTRFELQIHTEASLAAADETHHWYEELRQLRRRNLDPERQFVLQEMQYEVFDQVPIPPGTPIN